MIGLMHGLKIFICTEATDMRRGFDGLGGMASGLMQQDPLSGDKKDMHYLNVAVFRVGRKT